MHVKLTEVREARDTRLASGKVILSFPPISKRDFAETKKKKRKQQLITVQREIMKLELWTEGSQTEMVRVLSGWNPCGLKKLKNIQQKT